MSAATWIRRFNKKFPFRFEKYCGFRWPGWIRAPIWFATFMVLMGLMVRELSSNLVEYSWNNVVPEISVVVDGKVNPPNLTVCAPYYSDVLYTVTDWLTSERDRERNRTLPSKPCYECEGMTNNSWDVWRNEDIFAQENDPDVQLTIALVKKVVDSIEIANATLLNKTNAHWNQAIIDALWIFVSCRAISANEFFEGYPTDSYSCDEKDLSSLDYVSDETLDQLFDLLVDCIDAYVDLRLYPGIENVSSEIHTYIPTSPPRVPLRYIEGFTPLGHVMCFRLPPRTDYMSLRYGGFVFLPGTREPYRPWERPKQRPVEGRFMVYEDTLLYTLGEATVTLFQSDKETLGEMGSRYLQLTYNLQTYMDVRRQDSNCSNDNVPMSCKAKLQFSGAVEHCGCVPFLHRYLRRNDTSLRYCNASLYATCKDLKRTFSDFSRCTKRCEYADYKFWTVLNRRPENISEMALDLSLTPANGSSLKIDFTYKTTFAQFMSQIGGTLNLYLGLSGFTICACLFFLIDQAKRLRQRENNSVHASNQHAPILGLKTLGLVRMLQAAAKKDAGNKSGKTDYDAVMRKFEIMADRLDMLEGKCGKTDNDTMTTIMKKLEIVADRLTAVEGKCGKPDKDAMTTIMKNVKEMMDERLNVLVRKGAHVANHHRQRASSVGEGTTTVKL